MATYIKSDSGWKVRVRIKGQPGRSKTFPTKADATAWAQELERSIRKGSSIPDRKAESYTLAEAVERYITHTLPNKARNKDSKNLEQRLAWWGKHAGEYALSQITPAVVAEYRDRLTSKKNRHGKRISPQTVKHYLNALSTLMTEAVKEWHILESNPVERIRKPAVSNSRVRFLDDDERKALLSACRESESKNLYPIVVLALSTGMRQGEILGLHWKHVDLKRGRITLHETKNGDKRVVPLLGHALEVLKAHSKVRQLHSPFVFPGKTKSGHCEVRQSWYAAVRKAGLKDFRFHDLRHCAASYLTMNGASLTEVADVLGHRTLAMVKRYSHLSEAHTADIVGKMNEEIFNA